MDPLLVALGRELLPPVDRMMITRTPDEIVARIEELGGARPGGHDLHGSERMVLLDALPYPRAVAYLREGIATRPEDWPKIRTTDQVDQRAVEILERAWPRANRRKPTEASRNVPALRGLAWLARMHVPHLDGEEVQGGTTYPFHGKRALVAASEAFRFNWQERDDGDWWDSEGNRLDRDTALSDLR